MVMAATTSAVRVSRATRSAARMPIASIPCVPFTRARPSLASSRMGSSPARAMAGAAGSTPPSGASTSPWPISGSARFASGARSPDAPSEPCSGTAGIDVLVEHLDHQIDQGRTHARVAEREDVRTQQEHRARLLSRERATHGGRVRAHDAVLQLGRLRGIDPYVGERSESRRDAVDRGARIDRALDDRPGGHHALPRAAGERNGGAVGHRHDLRELEPLPDLDRHGGKATCSGPGRSGPPVRALAVRAPIRAQASERTASESSTATPSGPRVTRYAPAPGRDATASTGSVPAKCSAA